MNNKFKTLALIVALAAATAVGCSDNEIQKGNGTVKFTVNYNGSHKVYRLGYALFDESTYPPTTAPKMANYYPLDPVDAGLSFPYKFDLTPVTDGTYWIMVYGDIDPTDGYQPKTTDPMNSSFAGPITIKNGDTQNVTVTIFDPGASEIETETSDGDVDNAELTEASETVTPDAGKAAIYGTVNYSGSATGKLMITGFAANPPAGPPTLYIYQNDVVFPYYFEKKNASPGTYYILVYLDVDTEDGMTNNPALDPSSGDFKEFVLEADKAYKADFTLTDPK